jgi:hypothetical protein
MKQKCIPLPILLLMILVSCRAPQVYPELISLPVEEIASLPIEEINKVEEDAPQVEPAVLLPGSSVPVFAFKEIWAYLLSGSEDTLKAEFPLSDVGYFGAELDSYGKLIKVPDPRKLSFFKGRLHLVVTCGGRALTHFALAEGRPERRQLIADLLQASKPYAGLQIDFENVPPGDGDAFLSFLRELRQGLGNKVFTIALAARTRTLQDDVYDYTKIRPIVDRIFVMAYDEHWSTSAPGPVASLAWCQRVASYSLGIIGKEKLIMGLPFYGRTWGDINPNRAFFHSGIERIKREQGVTEVLRENGIPTFRYQTTLTVTVYYEDIYSLSSRLEMYRSMGVESVGFWCLGQETPEIWSILRIGN